MRSLLLGGPAEARRHVGGDAAVMGYCFGEAAVLELARSLGVVISAPWYYTGVALRLRI